MISSEDQFDFPLRVSRSECTCVECTRAREKMEDVFPHMLLGKHPLRSFKSNTDLIYKNRFEKWALAPDHSTEYRAGARVWIPHDENVWEGAKVTENYISSTIKLVTDEGQVREIKVSSDDELPPLRNPEILIGENDLTSLSYLHEPAVLYNLQVRFCRYKAIYTYCGIVLVAINPYQDMSIYGPDTIWAYRNRAMGDLDPHIFAVAEEAYTKMEREQSDQSIIVSGESGAGKTVSAKYAMRYFATVGGSATETQVERKVLASSPIMEAIGNAKTIRNDNSSRFGKYIELQFSRNYRIVGASMRTYLLEKSRVVFQSTGERNYHVFYQMCAAREFLPQLSLDDASAYNYLCDPDCKITGIDDEKAYEDTVSALSTLGFSKDDDIPDIFSVLASVLHLGNIMFEPGSHGDDASFIQASDKHLNIFCNLLGIDVNEMRQSLCNRKIISTRETFNKPMSIKEAGGARDALAKHIYAQLFSWIVDMVNKALNTSGESKTKFIGVLDIYGFETFDVNSFEQFCINYANEKLQQQFNLHVFKLEQEEYLKEGIEWKFIDFYDNQPCIDLIESKLGILDLLDEECRMPKGSDSSWAEKLYSKCHQRSHFVKPRFGTNSFIVKHFADKVEYEVSGFLEKNRDTVIEEQVTVLKSSSNRLVSRLFLEPGEAENKLAVPSKARVRVSLQQKPTAQAASRNKKTVGSQFRDSLNALMGTLNATTPHYIRCIKPNDEKTAFKFNPRRAVQQLRACGVLETIRISAAGFPSRWLYIEFFTRYRVLCHSKDINWKDMQLTCQVILNKLIKDPDKYKFGRAKIFFRAGQVAYLERLRSEQLLRAVVRIQKTVRGFLIRRRYTKTLTATNTLQRYVRGFLARRRAEGMRRNKAATKIQAYIRSYIARSRYLRLKKTALGLQARGRGVLARRKYLEHKRNKAATIIQKNARGWLTRKKYARQRYNIILAQATIRRFLARRRFRKIKREARSAEHLKKLNKGLENKIISLQQRIGEVTKELKSALSENNDLKSKVEHVKNLEVELKLVKHTLHEREAEFQRIQNEWQESAKLLQDREKEVEILKKQGNSLEITNNRLQTELTALRDDLERLKRDKQDEIRAQLQEEIRAIEEERAEERVRYQKLLAERDFLETKLEAAVESKHHKRSSSDVSTVSAQDDDVGYVSVRSTGSSVRDETPTPDYHVDLGLVLKYQQKLRELEVENYRLRMKLDSTKAPGVSQNEAEPLIVQELEMENAKLRNDLTVLRECIAADAINEESKRAIEEITREWKESEREVRRLRAENMELRRMFSGATMSAKSLAQSSYSSLRDFDSSVINEDGELVLAFEAQKRTLRQLEDELQSKTREWETEKEIIVCELEKVRGELERERAAVSSGAPSAYFEEHVTRLCSENLDLQERLDQQSAKCRRLAQQVTDLKKKLQEAGIGDNDMKALAKYEKSAMNESLPAAMVRKKEREYSGMFEIKGEDITVMLKHLLELKPRVAITLLPGLPSYILFMCVRYADHINDEEMVQSIILGYRKTMMKQMRKKGNDVDFGVLWLSNTLKLIHNLKQYSGEKQFAKDNTQTQNEQCLKNFDLREFRQVLSDTSVAICQTVMRHMEGKIQPLAVSAILEHEAIPGLASSGARGRSGSTASSLPTVRKAMHDLQSILTLFHRTLTLHGIDPELFSQFFRQLFYFLCANALNNLLLRREYCHWTKGMQIRFNLSHLEQWARENNIQDPRVLEVLAPIIQASQLLQARKTDKDVEPVAEMCSALSANQIIKLLNLYTGDGVEERVSESFIDKMQKYLAEHRPSSDNTLMMDVKHTFPLEFPFNPSSIRLEDIEIPEILNLPMLRKL